MPLPSRHTYLGAWPVLILLGQITACTTPRLCGEPLTDNRRLFKAINQMLRPLAIDPANYEPTLQEITRSLKQQPCVREVGFDETIIATEPALLYGRIVLGAGDQVFTKKLSLRFSGRKIWLEKIE